MRQRLTLLTTALLAIALHAAPPASADEIAYCWYEGGGNRGGAQQLHCRLVGGETVVYRDRGEVPGPLYPSVGDDGNGECWFERSVYTGWESFGINGTLNLLYFNPDGVPGGPLIAAAWFERCEGEPTVVEIIFDLVWEVMESFDFVEPDPELNPATGVTGLPTYMAARPPDPVVESIVSPVTGRVVEVEFVVTTVSIEWGDGAETEITPDLYPELVGYPNGDITHTYETSEFVDPVVDYNWRVRFRVDQGPWQLVAGVEPTTWTNPYQVDEIVGRVTG
jgi:hypothetical protein